MSDELTVRLCDDCAIELGKTVAVVSLRAERFRAACAHCRKYDRLLQFRVPLISEEASA